MGRHHDDDKQGEGIGKGATLGDNVNMVSVWIGSGGVRKNGSDK